MAKNIELWKMGQDLEDNRFDFNMYQILAQRTSKEKDREGKLVYGSLGLNGEAGEVADLIKKYMYHGRVLEKDKVVEELGDVLWYIAEVASGLGVSLEEMASLNISKLRKRYPEGFSEERSKNRDD